MPKARFIIWMNILISLIVSSIGFGLGFSQQWLPAQQVILYTILTSGSLFLILNYTASIFESRLEAERSKSELEREEERKRANNLWAENRILILSGLALLILYLLLTASITEFRSINNLLCFLVLELILVLAFKASGYFASGKSAFIGLIVLAALIVISAFSIEGFLSGPNIKAILLFAAFLGLASVGQTLVALMGGLDLSIPFVIGSSNIALLFLISAGVPSYVALGFILVLGGVVPGYGIFCSGLHTDYDLNWFAICWKCFW